MGKVIFLFLILFLSSTTVFAVTNSAINLDITDNADGFDVAGGTTSRKLTATGADMTLTGAGTSTYTLPSSAATLIGRNTTDTLTNKTLTGLVLTGGTTTVAPLTFSSGTNLGTITAGAVEYDGTWLYFSPTTGTNARNKVIYGDTTYLSSDFTTTSTTLTNVTGLAVSIPASQTWAFEFHLSTASSSSAGIQFAITVPSGATLEARIFGQLNSVTANRQERITTSGTATGVFTNSATVDGVQWISGICVNSTTAGTVQLQILKVTSGTATVYAKSCVIARRIS